MLKFSNPFHLVGNSPWPFVISILLLDFFISFLSVVYKLLSAKIFLFWTILILILSISLWFREIFNESLYKGEHTKIVNSNLLIGFILFVVSEIIIFFSLFLAYFYNSLIPSIELGSEWPPIGINILNPFGIPLLNTAILYFSGITMTISQNYLLNRNKYNSLFFLFITLVLAFTFTFIQYLEYYNASYSIYDSVYGTNFFILTGFHGIHVIIGSLLLIVSFFRLILNHFQTQHQIGYIVSGIYWHFVDVVWLVLYGFLYCWGA